MRIYKVSHASGGAGYVFNAWFSSRTQAAKRIAELRRENKHVLAELEIVDIPFGKTGLLDWLNANVNH